MFRGYSERTSERIMLHALTTYYDRDTREHAQRVVPLAKAIAHSLGLSRRAIFLVGMAALLHDIGKTDIAPAIVQKHGSLNDAEWGMMRLHPEIGQRMLLAAGGVFAELAPMVVAHHERWDGGGYPAGLMGEEIPTGARIIAVADSFDAMTSLRSYHRAMTVAEARAELWRCAGRQHDPRVVLAFFELLDQQTLPVAETMRAMPLFTPLAADVARLKIGA
jgi:HD-GYP domain-containing protein (c-di-GMP phosphodiesterase class II)